uniref:Uncharacterized protein n=1 Tax=Trichuris muris TaxID=70415 RepID=A0A5S6R405_TRIMR
MRSGEQAKLTNRRDVSIASTGNGQFVPLIPVRMPRRVPPHSPGRSIFLQRTKARIRRWRSDGRAIGALNWLGYFRAIHHLLSKGNCVIRRRSGRPLASRAIALLGLTPAAWNPAVPEEHRGAALALGNGCCPDNFNRLTIASDAFELDKALRESGDKFSETNFVTTCFAQRELPALARSVARLEAEE